MSDGATNQMWSLDDWVHVSGNADEADPQAACVCKRADRVPRGKTSLGVSEVSPVFGKTLDEQGAMQGLVGGVIAV